MRAVRVVSIMALLLAMVGSAPAHADPACSQDQSVYQQNEGRTDVRAHGSTHFSSQNSYPGGLGSGTLTYELRARITGDNTNDTDGDLAGFYNFSIDWDDAKPTTFFQSTCVLFVDTHVGNLYSMTYSGEMTGFPAVGGGRPEGGGADQGIARMSLKRVSRSHADLDFFLGQQQGLCQSGSFITIGKLNTIARGSKTGNGGRSIDACG